jgi:hypothetical protein
MVRHRAREILNLMTALQDKIVQWLDCSPVTGLEYFRNWIDFILGLEAYSVRLMGLKILNLIGQGHSLQDKTNLAHGHRIFQKLDRPHFRTRVLIG